LSDYEHVIALEHLIKAKDIENKDIKSKFYQQCVQIDKYKKMFQEEKALRLQAEKEAREFVTLYGEQNDILLNQVAELENKLKGKLQ